MKKCTGVVVYEKTKQGYTVYTAHAVSVSGSVIPLAIKKICVLVMFQKLLILY